MKKEMFVAERMVERQTRLDELRKLLVVTKNLEFIEPMPLRPRVKERSAQRKTSNLRGTHYGSDSDGSNIDNVASSSPSGCLKYQLPFQGPSNRSPVKKLKPGVKAHVSSTLGWPLLSFTAMLCTIICGLVITFLRINGSLLLPKLATSMVFCAYVWPCGIAAISVVVIMLSFTWVFR